MTKSDIKKLQAVSKISLLGEEAVKGNDWGIVALSQKSFRFINYRLGFMTQSIYNDFILLDNFAVMGYSNSGDEYFSVFVRGSKKDKLSDFGLGAIVRYKRIIDDIIVIDNFVENRYTLISKNGKVKSLTGKKPGVLFDHSIEKIENNIYMIREFNRFNTVVHPEKEFEPDYMFEVNIDLDVIRTFNS